MVSFIPGEITLKPPAGSEGSWWTPVAWAEFISQIIMINSHSGSKTRNNDGHLQLPVRGK